MRWFLLVLLGAFQAVAADTIVGSVVGVTDGDTLTILDAAKRRHGVRLAEIDAPEQGQAFYVESARSLARICLKRAAQVETGGKDRNGRWTGKVTCDGIDAATEQVRRGMAWVFAQQTPPNSPLYEMEAHARLRQLGLWAGKRPIPPWEWRQKRRAK